MAVTVSRVLHAGYIFECEGTRLLFDPLFENPFSRNCYAFPAVEFDFEGLAQERFSAVFISHYHDDHCSLESLRHLDRQTPVYMFCVFDEMFEMLKQMGFAHVHALKLNEVVKVGAFSVTPRRALDADVDSIFQIEAAGVKILNVVDSWIDHETLELLAAQGTWDLVLWPFQTMRELEVIAPGISSEADGTIPPEWIEQLIRLQPRTLIPSSCQFLFEDWSWYNRAFFPVSYAGFRRQVEAVLPETKIVRLNPGMSIRWHGGNFQQGARLPWIRPIGDQERDYVYDPHLVPATTAEIARRFPRASSAQADRVRRYCDDEILRRYSSLEPSEYFSAPRTWQLVVYDEVGAAQTWRYRIEGGQIVRELSLNEAEPDWTTEVPAARLYGALEDGESLTSMYIRVKPASGAEVLEDPLIRCLYDGIFGGYQRAQGRRMKAALSRP